MLPGVTARPRSGPRSPTTVTDDRGVGHANRRSARTGWRCRCRGSALRATGIVCRSTPTRDQRVAGLGNLGDRVGRSGGPAVAVRSAGISQVVEQEQIVQLRCKGAMSRT